MDNQEAQEIINEVNGVTVIKGNDMENYGWLDSYYDAEQVDVRPYYLDNGDGSYSIYVLQDDGSYSLLNDNFTGNVRQYEEASHDKLGLDNMMTGIIMLTIATEHMICISNKKMGRLSCKRKTMMEMSAI